MKTEDYLVHLICYTIQFITYTLLSYIFLVRKEPVFFVLCVICVLFIMLIIYLCIKNIEIRSRDSDLGENKNDGQ